MIYLNFGTEHLRSIQVWELSTYLRHSCRIVHCFVCLLSLQIFILICDLRSYWSLFLIPHFEMGSSLVFLEAFYRRDVIQVMRHSTFRRFVIQGRRGLSLHRKCLDFLIFPSDIEMMSFQILFYF